MPRECDLVLYIFENGGGDESSVEENSHDTDYSKKMKKAKKKPDVGRAFGTIPLRTPFHLQNAGIREWWRGLRRNVVDDGACRVQCRGHLVS